MHGFACVRAGGHACWCGFCVCVVHVCMCVWFLCVIVPVCASVQTIACVRACVCVCVCLYFCVCVCACVVFLFCLYVLVVLYVFLFYLCVCVCVCVHVFVFAYMCMWVSGGGGLPDAALRGLPAVHAGTVPGRPAAAAHRAGDAAPGALATAGPLGPCPFSARLHQHEG